MAWKGRTAYRRTAKQCTHLQQVVVLAPERAGDLLRDDDRVREVRVRDLVQLLRVVCARASAPPRLWGERAGGGDDGGRQTCTDGIRVNFEKWKGREDERRPRTLRDDERMPSRERADVEERVPARSPAPSRPALPPPHCHRHARELGLEQLEARDLACARVWSGQRECRGRGGGRAGAPLMILQKRQLASDLRAGQPRSRGRGCRRERGADLAGAAMVLG
jgi:hypothetical protein